LARYAEAKTVGDQYYQNLQIQAAAGYAIQRDNFVLAMENQLTNMSSSIPTLNSSSIQQANNYISQNGLPTVEQQILSGVGLSSAIPQVTEGIQIFNVTALGNSSLADTVGAMRLISMAQTDDIEQASSQAGMNITLSNYFTDSNLNPLPTDSSGTPVVSATLSNNIIINTNPANVLVWNKVANIGNVTLNSLKVNMTLPSNWQISSSPGQMHLYFNFTNGTMKDITNSANISQLNGNPQAVNVSIPDFNSTGAGQPLTPGASVLISIGISYNLIGDANTFANAVEYPDYAVASAWQGGSYTSSGITQ
jgi:hypothetical protein